MQATASIKNNPILLAWDGDRWVWSGEYSTRALPSSAGFDWARELKVWWTRDDAKAAILIRFASEPDRIRLQSHADRRNETLRASRAMAADVDLPCPRGRAYLPFQKAGIAFAIASDATLLGDEMGLGKTIQALGVINSVPAINRILILCPSSLKLNWQIEARRWLVRPMTIGIVKGDWFPLTTQMVVCNYDVLSRHEHKIKSILWDLVIIDEAHYIKNPKSLRTRIILGQPGKSEPIRADRKILLTGTPISNRPIELWPLLHYLDPARWKNFYRFGSRYCGMKKGRFGLEFKGADNLAELQETLRSTVMIRRLKRDVLPELPPKRRQLLVIERDDLAALMADECVIWDRSRAAVLMARCAMSGVPAGDKHYRQAVEKLRKAESLAMTEMSRVRLEIAKAKIPDVIECVRDGLTSGSIVCFAHHREVAAAIHAAFAAQSVIVTGEQAVIERQGAVERFQSDEKIVLFVGTIGAAGVGYTLTKATHVIFAELDWTPANLTQAEDRCHRIGQRESLLVQHLVVNGSLDQRMAEMIIRKQEIIDMALDDTDMGFDPWGVTR